MQEREKLYIVLGKQEDKVSRSTVAQWLTALEEKLGEIVANFAEKKGEKKVGANEVVQCSNDNCFLVFYVNVALSGSPVRRHTAKNAPL